MLLLLVHFKHEQLNYPYIYAAQQLILINLKYCLSGSLCKNYNFLIMSHNQKNSYSQSQRQDCDEVQKTQSSQQSLCFSNLVPDQKGKKQNLADYNKIQRVIQIAKAKSNAKAKSKKVANRQIEKELLKSKNKQKIRQQVQQRQRSRQKKKCIQVQAQAQEIQKQQAMRKKQIFLISDQEEQNEMYDMVQFDDVKKDKTNFSKDKDKEKEKEKENKNMQNLMSEIDYQMEAGQVKLLPQKFKQLQNELDLQKWEEFQFEEGQYQAKKAHRDQERRQKRKVERLLQKKYKQATIGKGKDKISYSVFNGIEDYFL